MEIYNQCIWQKLCRSCISMTGGQAGTAETSRYISVSYRMARGHRQILWSGGR
jgi:hypothetical protein